MNNSFTFLIFQRPYPSIFGQIITHNKYVVPLLKEDNDPIEAFLECGS